VGNISSQNKIMSYIYRNAEEKDKEEIYELYRTVMYDYISKIWGWDEIWQKSDFSTHYNAKEITIVLNNDQLVGYCQIEEKTNHFYIRMLAIIPGHQNNCIGKHLLKSLKDKCKKYSKNISLNVFKINTVAYEFYTKHGFSIIGETEHSYKMESNA